MRSRRALTYAPGRDWPEGHSLTSPPGVSRQAPEDGDADGVESATLSTAKED